MYFGILADYLIEKKIDSEDKLSEEQVVEVRKLIAKARTESFLDFFSKMKFKRKKQRIKNNSLSAAIACKLYGSDSRYAEVREKIVKFCQKNPEYQCQNFDEIVNLGYRFTQKELDGAAKLFNIPIIVFRPTNQMMFFDRFSAPKNKKGMDKDPLYLTYK